MKELFNRKEKIVLLTLVGFVVVGVGIHAIMSIYKPLQKGETVSFLLPDMVEPEVKGVFTVQVVGEVNNPGVYNIKMGQRVKDAIAAAGGAKDGACLEALNLALPVLDGMRIYVPPQGAPLDRPESFITYGYGESTSYQQFDIALDLNTATKEQLMSLPGIGEKRAEAIIKYREKQGGFVHKKELLNIDLINEDVYREIEGLVEVK